MADACRAFKPSLTKRHGAKHDEGGKRGPKLRGPRNVLYQDSSRANRLQGMSNMGRLFVTFVQGAGNHRLFPGFPESCITHEHTTTPWPTLNRTMPCLNSPVSQLPLLRLIL